MRRQLAAFLIDVDRYSLFGAISLATLVSLPSLLLVLHGTLGVGTAIERFALAYGFALLAARFIRKLLFAYASDLAERRLAEENKTEAAT